MKNLKLIFSIFTLIVFLGCTNNDDGLVDVTKNVAAPANIALTLTMSQDNSGLVSITPTGEGATMFEVFYGDSANESVVLEPGQNTTHVYNEGTYQLNVIATGINGLTTEYTQQLQVSFLAPENLSVNIETVDGNVFSRTISASADLEAYFEFYPGVAEDEEPIQFTEDSPLTYTYESIGDYTIKVIAYSGGSATTEYTEIISIVNPLLLPITFEDSTLNYPFIDFGGAATSLIANPDMTGTNSSSMVAQSIKTAGAETYAGTIITLDEAIDFSSVQNIKVDVWSPKSGITVKLKLENISDPNISTEIDVINTVSNEWETLYFSFSDSDLTQDYGRVIIFFDFGTVGDESTYYFDNISLTGSNGGAEPEMAAPTPAAANVISLFSDAYDDVSVDTWNTVWSNSGYEDVLIQGNATKKYFNLGFNGIETTTTPVDASGAGMTYLHLDVWTPNMTALKIKLVDFEGDGFQGASGDTEAELTFNPTQGEWVAIDIPLSAFAEAGMTNFSDINQYIISSEPYEEGIVFIDNVYFYNNSTEPTSAAPSPTVNESNVISLFSDSYTDVSVDTWNTSWSNAAYEEVMVDGNATKLYTRLGFNGIETVTSPVDASSMTYIHMDIWTPNITTFKIKLVDFKGDGYQGGNGDTEAELSYTPSQGGWVSLEIPLADFEAAGMTNFSDINQYIFSSEPYEQGTVYVDNVYFHN